VVGTGEFAAGDALGDLEAFVAAGDIKVGEQFVEAAELGFGDAAGLFFGEEPGGVLPEVVRVGDGPLGAGGGAFTAAEGAHPGGVLPVVVCCLGCGGALLLPAAGSLRRGVAVVVLTHGRRAGDCLQAVAAGVGDLRPALLGAGAGVQRPFTVVAFAAD